MTLQTKLLQSFILLLLLNIATALKAQSNNLNYCLGGVQIKNINAKQRAFNKGPCAPLIMVPGFLGTALQVQIDCQILFDNHPQIFQYCGWSTCNSIDPISIFRMPKKQYRLWIGDLTDKFSAVQTNQQKCLASFLKFQSGQQKNYTQPKGIKITWVGNTPQTISNSNCGVSAVQNLLGGKFSLIRNCALNGMQKSIKMLQSLGYISGINFQAIPYDYRKTVEFSQANGFIKTSIQNLFKNTGKKVVLYGHSYGSFHLLKVLHQLSNTEKQQKIQHFISIGAPYLGASKALRSIIGGDSSYTKSFLSMQLGFNYFSQQALVLGSRSVVHFLPRFNLKQFEQSKWFQDSVKCPPNWLPQNDSNFPLAGILKTYANPILKLCNQTTFQSDKNSYKRLFGHLSNSKSTYFRDLLDQGFKQFDPLFNLKKPDVNTTLIFSGAEPTQIQFSYDSINDQDKFNTPAEVLLGGGDGTVPSISNIAVALKWISQKNKGGVKLINYGAQKNVCNKYYSTIPSQCLNNGNSNCLHGCFHQDPNVLKYLAKIILNSEKKQQGRLVHQTCQNLKPNNVILI